MPKDEARSERERGLTVLAVRLADAWKYKGEDRDFFIEDVKVVLQHVLHEMTYRLSGTRG